MNATAYAQTSLAISNLRGAFILILVSFHACLAYLGSTPATLSAFDQPPYLWLAFPIVDPRRFYGFDLYCAWEDVHVMSLMFFLSGLFMGPSLRRKGAGKFAADRLLRLGLPFLFSVFMLMPVAIYPVYLQRNPSGSLAEYLAAYRDLPFLPNGPTWFLWILLAISLGLAALYALWPRGLDALARFAADARRAPKRFLVALFASATVAYLPPTLAYGPFDWFERGLFSLQLSRPLLYAVYLFAGAAVGSAGLGDGLLAPDGVLARRWRRLGVASPAFLFVWMGLTGVALTYPAFAPTTIRTLAALAYVGASVAGVMLLMAASVRFCARRIGLLAPLSRNALGIFVIHYAPLVWMQYALLDIPLPAVCKAAIVFGVTLPVSLAVAMALRKHSLLARLIGEEADAAIRPAIAPTP